MSDKDYPITEIRAQFPALKRMVNGKQIAFFDGPSGSQIVQASIDAIVDYLANHNANHGGKYPTSFETEEIVEDGRKAMADLLGAHPREIAYGQNMTSLMYSVHNALSRTWQKGDEIVVTQMDHRAHVDPLIQYAENRGVKVNWIPLDIETFTLDYTELDRLINENTKLVAIGHASNGLGTINDVAMVSKRAKEVSSLVSVDAVHSTPHVSIDMKKLGADMIFCSAYKFYGPHLGIVAIKESIFEKLNTYKVKPAPESHPDKLETGTQSHEAIAGTTASVDFLASIGSGSSRRDKLVSSYDKIHKHENDLANYLREELSKIKGLRLFQAESEVPKAPTVAFRVGNQSPDAVCEWLSNEFTIFAGSGHYYALTIGDLLDLNSTGGWIRTGLSVYTNHDDVQRLIDAIKKISN